MGDYLGVTVWGTKVWEVIVLGGISRGATVREAVVQGELSLNRQKVTLINKRWWLFSISLNKILKVASVQYFHGQLFLSLFFINY